MGRELGGLHTCRVRRGGEGLCTGLGPRWGEGFIIIVAMEIPRKAVGVNSWSV